MTQYCLCFGRKEEKKPKKEEGKNFKFSRTPEMASAKAQLENEVVAGHVIIHEKQLENPGDGHVKHETQLENPVYGHPRGRVFSYSELASATNNFSDEAYIGEGGFGKVYKGVLKNTGLIIAAKKLKESALQGGKEFDMEVSMLSSLRHQNLVILIGYCSERDERILVYEFIPSGSLEYHLCDLTPDMAPLDWNTRVTIALGAAKGLSYLHKQTPPVIYRDMKSANILLDHNNQPKLSDFGLAKFGPALEDSKSHVSTRVMGTYGYCAPDYAATGKLTLKSDIYSFGVVLFEIITGRKALDKTRPSCDELLLDWVKPYLRERNYIQLADPKLKGQIPLYKLKILIELANRCVNQDPRKRPNVKEVIVTLSGVIALNYDPFSAHLKAHRLGIYPPSSAEGVEEVKRSEPCEGSVRKERVMDGGREKAVAETKMWALAPFTPERTKRGT